MEGAAPKARAPPNRFLTTSGDGSDVGALRALLALGHLVLDLLVLLEVAIAVARDRAEVHEDVGATVILSDESEALLGVEPLDGSGAHERSLLPCPFPSLAAARGATGPKTGRELLDAEPRSIVVLNPRPQAYKVFNTHDFPRPDLTGV